MESELKEKIARIINNHFVYSHTAVEEIMEVIELESAHKNLIEFKDSLQQEILNLKARIVFLETDLDSYKRCLKEQYENNVSMRVRLESENTRLGQAMKKIIRVCEREAKSGSVHGQVISSIHKEAEAALNQDEAG